MMNTAQHAIEARCYGLYQGSEDCLAHHLDTTTGVLARADNSWDSA